MFRTAPYKLDGFARMHDECPLCGQDFRIEPGFYMGGSDIHYALCVVVILLCLLLYFWLIPTASEMYFIVMALLANLVALPFGFRASRVLMLHFFGSVHYDPDAIRRQPHLMVDAAGNLIEE